MKATAVKPPPPAPDKAFKCAMCGVDATKPYGYVAHGASAVCSKKCDIAYENRNRNEVKT